MPTPSLILVPARFKTGKLYTPLATTSGGTVLGASGDFNVTRATSATRVNASGLIESVASGIPRLDYFASGGVVGCPALLVEPAATNTLSGSVSIDTGWISSNEAQTSGIVSPSGSNNASLFEAQSTTTRVRQTATLASGSTYTFSCFGKFGALSSGFSLNVFDENVTSYGSGVVQAFNLNNGTLGSSGTVGAGFTLQSVGMEDYGNGWYRCRMTVLMGYTPTTPRVGFRIGTAISGGRPLSVVSGTVNVWGAQTETGSVATSYIPTTTAPVTRNADVINLSGAVSGSIGQTEGSIYAEVNIQKLLGATQRAIVDIGQSGNRLFLGYGNGLTNQIRFLLQTSLGGLVDINSSATSTGTIKIAVGYKNNNSIMYVNGVSGTVLSNDNFTSSLNALTGLSIGSSNIVSETHFLNDRIRAAALYTTRLTNAQLQALTT